MAAQSNNLLGETNRRINEGATRTYSFTLEDAAGDPIALADIEAFTMTLYDANSQGIINERDAQSILNTNDVTVHATSGLVTWSMQSADNAIQSADIPAGQFERHIAEFVVTTTAGDVLAYEEAFDIKAFLKRAVL